MTGKQFARFGAVTRGANTLIIQDYGQQAITCTRAEAEILARMLLTTLGWSDAEELGLQTGDRDPRVVRPDQIAEVLRQFRRSGVTVFPKRRTRQVIRAPWGTDPRDNMIG